MNRSRLESEATGTEQSELPRGREREPRTEGDQRAMPASGTALARFEQDLAFDDVEA